MTAATPEFPDYPAADLPPMPDGFEDSSWSNDACPCFVNAALGLMFFADYAKRDDREFPEADRFSLQEVDGEGCMFGGEPVFVSEDWTEVLAEINKRREKR
jgi:hypothetical protein